MSRVTNHLITPASPVLIELIDRALNKGAIYNGANLPIVRQNGISQSEETLHIQWSPLVGHAVHYIA